MAKVRLNLRDMTIPEKVAFARQVISAMTNNTNFPTPTPTLGEVTVAANDLEVAANQA
jgi:hypothetical protein